MSVYYRYSEDELYHHGILGQKWGVRRYQNYDGSLTYAGRKHYGIGRDGKIDVSTAKNSQTRKVASDYNTMNNTEFMKKYYTTKHTFAKRYSKTEGDTYSLGRKKQAMAKAFLKKRNKKSPMMTKAEKQRNRMDRLLDIDKKSVKEYDEQLKQIAEQKKKVQSIADEKKKKKLLSSLDVKYDNVVGYKNEILEEIKEVQQNIKEIEQIRQQIR